MGCLVSRYIGAGRSQATIGHLLLMVEAGLVAGAGGEDESSAVARSHPAVTASSTPLQHTAGSREVIEDMQRVLVVNVRRDLEWILLREMLSNQYCHIDSL